MPRINRRCQPATISPQDVPGWRNGANFQAQCGIPAGSWALEFGGPALEPVQSEKQRKREHHEYQRHTDGPRIIEFLQMYKYELGSDLGLIWDITRNEHDG